MAELFSGEPHGVEDVEIISSQFLLFPPAILLSAKIIKQLFKLRDKLQFGIYGNSQYFKFAKEIFPFVEIVSFCITAGTHC